MLDVTRKIHQALASKTISIVELWHQGHGHINHNDIMLLQNNTMVEGLHVLKNDHVECESCLLGKKHREEFPIHKGKRQKEIIELIHTDVCGPVQTRSIGGTWYFIIFLMIDLGIHGFIS